MDEMIKELKAHPEYEKMGMIASHLGVVRKNSLSGRNVKYIEIEFDNDSANNIINEIKTMKGIVEVLVDFNSGRLNIGDNIMAVVVGGDIRENVFPALIKAVDRIKTEASSKKEYF